MSTHWKTWIWILVVGFIHIYILYCSIHRYVSLKYEVFNNFYVDNREYKWILSLLNYQLYVIIVSLGILPLWVYSMLFSSSSFLWGNDLTFNRKGFYQLVWDEALNILTQHVRMELSGVQRKTSKCCRGNIKFAVFFPISNLLHILMAYLFILPIPYTEAWLVQTNDDRQESIWSGLLHLEFSGSNNLSLKFRHSVEYLNFFFSLLSLSFQFPKLLWLCNRSFSIFLNSIQILVTIHILVNFSLFSIFIKFYYKQHLHSDLFISPLFILTITIISDLMLILASFPYFQFGFEKAVQCLLTSTWFNNLNRSDNIPLVNCYEQSNCHSTTSSSAAYSTRNFVEKRNSSCPSISAAILFLCGIGMKIIACYSYWQYISSSRYLMAYVIHSSVLVVAYFLIWFGVCLKPDWIFSVSERQLSQYSIITYPEKAESNYYKSLRSQQGNSQISLSFVSNNNCSVQSMRREYLPRPDCASQNQYLTQSTSLNLPPVYKSTPRSTNYQSLSNHISQSSPYKSTYACNSLSGAASPTITNFVYKDNIRSMTSSTKYSTPSYSILRSNDSTRSDESDEYARKFKKNCTIHEEIYNKTGFSSTEDDDEVFTMSGNSISKNNSQLKFVTFQLDKNGQSTADLCSSNDNLTLVSCLDTSEKFLKELENDVDNQLDYTSFKTIDTVKDGISSVYVLESSARRPIDSDI